jgi:hypothetical protein
VVTHCRRRSRDRGSSRRKRSRSHERHNSHSTRSSRGGSRERSSQQRGGGRAGHKANSPEPTPAEKERKKLMLPARIRPEHFLSKGKLCLCRILQLPRAFFGLAGCLH